MEDQKNMNEIEIDSQTNLEEAVEDSTDEAFLFDIAMNHTRKHRSDDWIAETAVWRISDPGKLMKIAVGAADYPASLEALQSLEDDEMLQKVILEVPNRSDLWESPQDLSKDRSHLINNIREIAAEAIKNKALLLKPLLAETSGSKEPPGDAAFLMIGMLAKEPELLRQYIEQEENMAALMYVSSIPIDLSLLHALKARWDHLFSNQFSFETAMLEEKVAMAEHAEAAWRKFEAMTEAEQKEELSRSFRYDSWNHSGFDTVTIGIDEEDHVYEVSEIGCTEADFLDLVETLPENGFTDLVWQGEPGRWVWFLCRRNGMICAEVPGFEKPLYRLYSDFCRTVGCMEPEAQPTEETAA